MTRSAPGGLVWPPAARHVKPVAVRRHPPRRNRRPGLIHGDQGPLAHAQKGRQLCAHPWHIPPSHQILPITPTMAAGVVDHVWILDEVIAVCPQDETLS